MWVGTRRVLSPKARFQAVLQWRDQNSGSKKPGSGGQPTPASEILLGITTDSDEGRTWTENPSVFHFAPLSN